MKFSFLLRIKAKTNLYWFRTSDPTVTFLMDCHQVFLLTDDDEKFGSHYLEILIYIFTLVDFSCSCRLIHATFPLTAMHKSH